MTNSARFWIWLTLATGVNNPKHKRIYETYDSIADFYNGGVYEWRLCGIFSPKDIDSLDLNEIGPCFEKADIFPERINTEFVRVVNRHTIKMRAYERGNKETFACGTGAAAAVVAAVENGFCDKGEEITVKLKGGDLAVTYDDNGIFLTGNAVLVYEGEAEY